MGTEACEISQPVNRLDLTLSPHEERAGRELERGAARGSIAAFCDAPPLPGPLLRCAEERESGASSSTDHHRRLVSGFTRLRQDPRPNAEAHLFSRADEPFLFERVQTSFGRAPIESLRYEELGSCRRTKTYAQNFLQPILLFSVSSNRSMVRLVSARKSSIATSRVLTGADGA
jgi:hypothetical protein